MRVAQVLRNKGAEVVVISPAATVEELVSLLSRHNLGAVVVSEDGKTVLGLVSERDVIRRLADGTSVLTESVATIMSSSVHTCGAADSVESLMTVMTEQRVRHLPVLSEDHELCGIVSIGDVVKSTITQLEFERDQLQGYVTS